MKKNNPLRLATLGGALLLGALAIAGWTRHDNPTTGSCEAAPATQAQAAATPIRPLTKGSAGFVK